MRRASSASASILRSFFRSNMLLVRKHGTALSSPGEIGPSTTLLRVSLQFCRARTGHKNPPRPEIRKKYEKITKSPTLGRSGPENTKKITEKIQKWPENDHFCIFSVIFSCFRGPTQGGRFCNFFVFPALGGCCALYEPDGIARVSQNYRCFSWNGP